MAIEHLSVEHVRGAENAVARQRFCPLQGIEFVFVFLGGRRKSGGVGRKVSASDLGGIICLLATSPRAVALTAHLTIDAALTHRTNYWRVTPRSFEAGRFGSIDSIARVARASIVGIADFPSPGTRANAARHFLCRAPARSID